LLHLVVGFCGQLSAAMTLHVEFSFGEEGLGIGSELLLLGFSVTLTVNIQLLIVHNFLDVVYHKSRSSCRIPQSQLEIPVESACVFTDKRVPHLGQELDGRNLGRKSLCPVNEDFHELATEVIWGLELDFPQPYLSLKVLHNVVGALSFQVFR